MTELSVTSTNTETLNLQMMLCQVAMETSCVATTTEEVGQAIPWWCDKHTRTHTLYAGVLIFYPGSNPVLEPNCGVWSFSSLS